MIFYPCVPCLLWQGCGGVFAGALSRSLSVGTRYEHVLVGSARASCPRKVPTESERESGLTWRWFADVLGKVLCGALFGLHGVEALNLFGQAVQVPDQRGAAVPGGLCDFGRGFGQELGIGELLFG